MTTIPQSTQQYQFEGMPDELVMNVLLKLPYNDVINACVTNKRLAKICESKFFLAQKANRDFGTPVEKFNLRQGNPREVYVQFEKLHKLKLIVTMIYDLAKDLSPANIELETQSITNLTPKQNMKIFNILNTYQTLPQDIKEGLDTFNLIYHIGTRQKGMNSQNPFVLLVGNYSVHRNPNSYLIPFVLRFYNLKIAPPLIGPDREPYWGVGSMDSWAYELDTAELYENALFYYALVTEKHELLEEYVKNISD